MKPDKRRIINELEEMLAQQVMYMVEVDVCAREIFKKFIEPLIDYKEIIHETTPATNKPD